MTTTDNTDKLYDHHRQQLSAMMDGALSPDEARFLLRRLQHDTELAACWERWQVSGDVLRAHARGALHAALLPANFSQRVAKAIAGDSATAAATASAATKSRMVRWAGGGALAASIAAVALFIARQAPQALDAPATDAAQVVAASPSAPAPRGSTRQPQPPSAVAASLATAMAVAQVPRRANARRTSRAQSQRAAIRVNASQDIAKATSGLIVASAPAIVDAGPTALADPFGAQPIAPGRPWPRALLPNARAVGGLTVDYGRANTQTINPFEPRALEATEPLPEDSAPY